MINNNQNQEQSQEQVQTQQAGMRQITDRQLRSNIDKLVREIEVANSFWKTITLGVLNSFAGLGFGFFMYQLLRTAHGSIWAVLLSLAVLSALFLMQTIMVSNRKYAIGFIFLTAIFMSLPFLTGGSVWVSVLAFIAVFLMMVWAYERGRWELGLYIKLSFLRVAMAVVTKLSNALVVFVALAYISVFLSGSVSLVSQDWFRKVLNSSSGWVNNFYPDFSFDNTLRENVEIIAGDQIEKNPYASSITPEQKKILVDESVRNYSQGLENIVKEPVDVDKPTVAIVYGVVSDKADELINEYGFLAYIVLALVIVFVLKGVMWIINWPLIVVAWLMYQVLWLMGFFSVLSESANREFIVLD